jgi:hypothetical protein
MKKNRAKRRSRKEKPDPVEAEWEAARKNITLFNQTVTMLPMTPRTWEYPVTWNLPKDPDAETQPSATETPDC